MIDFRQTFVMPGTPAGQANGNSDTIVVNFATKLTVQISEANSGPFVATVEIWGRVHESLPLELIDSYTGPMCVVLGHHLYAVQLRVSGYASGTIVAGVAGLLTI